MHNKRRGFTLAELIVTLGVLAVVSGAVFFAISGRDSSYREIRSAGYQILSDIRYARQRAVMDGETVEIVFHGSDGRYTIRYASPRASIREGRLPENVWFVHNRDRVYHFMSRGTPSEGFTIQLRTAHHRLDVRVVASGGRVRVYNLQEVD